MRGLLARYKDVLKYNLDFSFVCMSTVGYTITSNNFSMNHVDIAACVNFKFHIDMSTKIADKGISAYRNV
jgi:hypothetical protein